MIKFLLLIAVVAFGIWLFRSKGRRRSADAPRSKDAKADPQPMLVCAHCGVHLPQVDAKMDVGGRPYCSDAHRLAGPR
jgi:uncharacterized protein